MKRQMGRNAVVEIIKKIHVKMTLNKRKIESKK